MFSQPVLHFEEVSSINITPARHSEGVLHSDCTLVSYISDFNAWLYKTRNLIFISMLGINSSLEERLTLFSTQRVIWKSECQFINPKEDQNGELVDEPIFH